MSITLNLGQYNMIYTYYRAFFYNTFLNFYLFGSTKALKIKFEAQL